jgi:hypothetical protein
MNAVGVNNRLDDLENRVIDLEGEEGGMIGSITSTDGTVTPTKEGTIVDLSIQGLTGVSVGDRALTALNSRQVLCAADFDRAYFELTSGATKSIRVAQLLTVRSLVANSTVLVRTPDVLNYASLRGATNGVILYYGAPPTEPGDEDVPTPADPPGDQPLAVISYDNSIPLLTLNSPNIFIIGKQLTGFATFVDTNFQTWTQDKIVTADQIVEAITNVVAEFLNTAQGGGTVVFTTTVGGYDESMIGCFCQSTGTVVSPGSPVVEVASCFDFNEDTARGIIGIIQGPNTVVTHGPVFCRQSGPLSFLDVGDFLVPNQDGCQPATPEQRTTIISSGMPRVRIMNDEVHDGMFDCLIN